MDNQHGFFSRKLRAGKRRTYFFDVRSTKQGDYFVTITESKRRFDKPGYDSHKLFLYKEDFKKFTEALNETVDHIKTELNPDFDYDSYDRNTYNESHNTESSETSKEEVTAAVESVEETINTNTEVAEPSFELDEISDTSEEIDKEAMEW